MLCKCHWIVLYTVHFTAFCLGVPFFHGHGVLLNTGYLCFNTYHEQAFHHIVRQLSLDLQHRDSRRHRTYHHHVDLSVQVDADLTQH